MKGVLIVIVRMNRFFNLVQHIKKFHSQLKLLKKENRLKFSNKINHPHQFYCMNRFLLWNLFKN